MKLSVRKSRPAPGAVPAAIHDVLWQNEVQANHLTAVAMCIVAGVALLTMLFSALGIFTENPETINSTCIATVLWHVLPALVCFYYRSGKPWIKYMLLVCLTLGQARLDCGLGYHVILCIALPAVFSTRYYSHRLTISMAAVTTVVFSLTTYVGAATGFTPVNLNLLGESEHYGRDVMVYGFLPRWMVFVVIAGICAEIARQGRNMVFRQAQISQEHSRVETELYTASQIQLHSLPAADTVLAGYEDCFELAAAMTPAKEVGGDFYDFFYIDPTHLALVIADVSGKGVPAALFMMVSKVMLDMSVKGGLSPSGVLTAVNRLLCEKDLDSMFVTVWLGILDLRTGDIVSANAGHENPILCRRDGTAEVVRTRHGMVVGGIDCARYRDETLHLDPGDTLFVYTDGIPEANSGTDGMFGMDRLTAALQDQQETPLRRLLDTVQQKVSAFAGDAPQFDDCTMLALRMKRYRESGEAAGTEG